MYVNFRILFIFAIIILFYNCKSTATVAEIDNLKTIVNKKNFEIVANTATPVAFANTRGLENLLPPGSNLASINLSTNQNYIQVKNDSLLVDLPYFGELQMSSGYNSDGGIYFEGIPTTSKFVFNQKKKSYEIYFNTKFKNESFKFLITLFPNYRSSIVVNSSNRTTITYNGIWKEL